MGRVRQSGYAAVYIVPRGRVDEVSFCPPRSWNSQDEEEWVSMPRARTGTRRARRAGETKGVFEEAKVELLGRLEWWMMPGG